MNTHSSCGFVVFSVLFVLLFSVLYTALEQKLKRAWLVYIFFYCVYVGQVFYSFVLSVYIL